MFSWSVLFAIIALTSATSVNQCPGRSDSDLADRVELMPCKKLPCKLKKGTDQHITVKFIPETDIQVLKNHVTADVFGVELPFIGVDNMPICDKLFTVSGEKAPCPLKAGTEYMYKDSFPILSVYPSLNTRVHWSLQHDGKDVACFEVPVRIA